MRDQYDTLDLEFDGGWLTVWFNEPARRNPLTQARVADLCALCDDLMHSDLRGVTFRGRGGVFSAGGDLKAFGAIAAGQMGADQIAQMSRDGARLFDAVARLPQVTVAVAQGAALAGGLGLACATDVVIADPQCRFSLTEVRMGLVAAQIAPFVVARIGVAAARRLMVLGADIDAGMAAALGLVDHVADDPDAILATLRGQVAQTAPHAVAATKALLRDMPADRDGQIALAARVFTDAVTSEQGREGLAAFAQKRPPKWKDAPC